MVPNPVLSQKDEISRATETIAEGERARTVGSTFEGKREEYRVLSLSLIKEQGNAS